jgi:DNA-directed RNA polymerase subunit H (RpoH/RPB5)
VWSDFHHIEKVKKQEKSFFQKSKFFPFRGFFCPQKSQELANLKKPEKTKSLKMFVFYTFQVNSHKYATFCVLVKMHVLQPKHTKLKSEEARILLSKYDITLLQLPKIKKIDPALPEDTKTGDIIKIERKVDDKKVVYYRVVVD